MESYLHEKRRSFVQALRRCYGFPDRAQATNLEPPILHRACEGLPMVRSPAWRNTASVPNDPSEACNEASEDDR